MLKKTEYISRTVQIGLLSLGGEEKVRIQSMTNTPTMDTERSYRQIMELYEVGCEMVRLTARNIREAENLASIRTRLENSGVYIPLAADIHFNPKIAERAAGIVHKVRINPGNYLDQQHFLAKEKGKKKNALNPEIAGESIRRLTDICQQHNTVIRVGVNHGSLSDRMLMQYGNTAEGMVASAMEFLELCRKADFNELVVSMKSSHVPSMLKANLLLVSSMMDAGMDYPIHLGVTEAGEGEDGRIRSAAGIGPLLKLGIGNTIRVSLTEDPVAEIPVAKKLVEIYESGEEKYGPVKSEYMLSGPSLQKQNVKRTLSTKPLVVGDLLGEDPGGREPDLKPVSDDLLEDIHGNTYELSPLHGSEGKASIPKSETTRHLVKLEYSIEDQEEFMLAAVSELSLLVMNKRGNAYWLINNTGRKVYSHPEIIFGALQATAVRISGTEYISCPGCGRTSFDIQGSLKKIKAKTKGMKNIKIAVMGCIVNGPGEMADADYGYVGEGNGRISLYHAGKVVKKNIEEDDALDELLGLISATHQEQE